MGYRRSVQDEVLKVSISVFIMNFSDQAGAKELWNACKQYGYVVDAFIPDRRSKIRKSFGFVRFIKVFDAERLVNNLCTVWIGSHRLYANIARFQRPTGQNSSINFSHNGEKQKDDKGNNGNFNSDAHVLKGVSHPNKDTMNTQSLVISDDCVNQEDYSWCLNGNVKEFGSLSNLKVVLGNDGFNEIRIRYLGGLWVMLVFRALDGKEKFKVNVSTNSWFSQLIETFSDFVVDGRVAWVEEDFYHNKRMCIFTADMVNIFESFKIIYQGKTFWVLAKEVPGWSLEFEKQLDEDSEPEYNMFGGVDKPNTDNRNEEFEDENLVLDTMFDDGSVKPSVVKNSSGNQGNKSEDPFDLYPLLNKNKGEKNKDSNCSESLKFPRGFIPNVEKEVGCNMDKQELNCDNLNGGASNQGDHVNAGIDNSHSKRKGTESVGSGRFKNRDALRIGGSILMVMDELIKGSSVGNSGCILCVWDTNSFKKLNATVSDYFTLLRENWVSNGKLLLIVSVYSPKELTVKKMLWDYLMHMMASWKGDVIIMGDFNEAGLEEIPLGGCSFTWCHRSGSNMSKLDQFLALESLLSVCHTLSSITLDRFLLDHRPILLRESTYDYGPSPFRFFKYWAKVDGFEKLIMETWSHTAACGSNDMLNLMYKLKNLKKKIRGWNSMRQSFKNSKIMLKLIWGIPT
nr:RNA-directed DNA polymerase, eukaryota, nucleotide-binding alpha-beta plait domain protein [Tanacetum cinerariifolium]